MLENKYFGARWDGGKASNRSCKASILYNDSGKYRGDDEAVLLAAVVTDNDTTGKAS